MSGRFLVSLQHTWSRGVVIVKFGHVRETGIEVKGSRPIFVTGRRADARERLGAKAKDQTPVDAGPAQGQTTLDVRTAEVHRTGDIEAPQNSIGHNHGIAEESSLDRGGPDLERAADLCILKFDVACQLAARKIDMARQVHLTTLQSARNDGAQALQVSSKLSLGEVHAAGHVSAGQFRLAFDRSLLRGDDL